jgi:hypothetical protein
MFNNQWWLSSECSDEATPHTVNNLKIFSLGTMNGITWLRACQIKFKR